MVTIGGSGPGAFPVRCKNRIKNFYVSQMRRPTGQLFQILLGGMLGRMLGIKIYPNGAGELMPRTRRGAERENGRGLA